jgi:hypothetical protein
LTSGCHRRLTIRKKTQKKPKTGNGNPPASKRPRYAITPRLERPSEAAGPAATSAEGTETLAALGIASFSYFSSYPFVGIPHLTELLSTMKLDGGH